MPHEMREIAENVSVDDNVDDRALGCAKSVVSFHASITPAAESKLSLPCDKHGREAGVEHTACSGRGTKYHVVEGRRRPSYRSIGLVVGQKQDEKPDDNHH